MKIKISNSFRDDIEFNTIFNCVEYFLNYEIRFGYFDKHYQDHIFQIIDDFKQYNKINDKLILELFIHDYSYFSKYKKNPNLYIPIEHYNTNIHFEIDLDKYTHLSMEKVSDLFKHQTLNISNNILISDCCLKSEYFESFKNTLFNQIIYPVISPFNDFNLLNSIEDLTEQEIELVKILKI